MPKNPTDLIGNELLKNDLVAVKIGSEILIGRVAATSSGGIAVDGSGKETPPFVAVALNPYTIICHPHPKTGQVNTNIQTMYKMFDPENKALLDALTALGDPPPH